jgi:hypothetical protein
VSLIASPNPVPWNQTGCFVSGSTGNNGDEATKIERQVNGGGYSQVAINLLGSAGALNYSDTFSAEGDVHDFKFYAGADEFSMTLQDTLTGVKRGRKQAVGSSIAPAASLASVTLKRSRPITASIAAASTPSAPLLKVARALSASIAGLSTPSTPLLKVARRLVGSAVTGAATLATPILARDSPSHRHLRPNPPVPL